VKESSLANGVKVVSREFDSSAAQFSIAIRGGSRAEAVNEKGSAHMIAGAAFYGTSEKSGLYLCRSLEVDGVKFGATSDREKIVYEFSATSQTALSAFETVSEAVVFPVDETHTLDETKSYVKHGYKGIESCPFQQLKELMHEASFGEGTPLGSSPYSPNLAALPETVVLNFRTRNFVGSNVVVAGNGVSHKDLEAWSEKWFGGLPKGDNSVNGSPYQGGEFRERKNLGGKTYMGLSFPIPQGAEAAKVHKVLASMLANRLSNIPAPNGTLSAFFNNYSTGGIFGIYSTGNTEDAVKNLQLAVAELKAISGSAGDACVNASKTKLALKNAAGIEGSSSNGLLSAVLAGESVAAHSDYSAVSGAKVSAAAGAALKSTPSFAVMGKTLGVPSFSDVVKMTK